MTQTEQTERFESGWGLTIMAIIIVLVFLVTGYSERGFDQNVIGSVMIVSLGVLLYYSGQITTYLEIRDKRTLINSGYRDFRRDDPVDIYDIKYILRAPAFVVKIMGSIMAIFATDESGTLYHISVRERAYPGETIKRFLTRVKQLNPSIVLDDTYQELLDGKFDAFDLTGKPAKKSVHDIEHFFEEKGERWRHGDTIWSLIDRFK